MKGVGWGSLEMEGEFPWLKTSSSEKKGRGNRGVRRERLGPSDIVFPSSSSSSEEKEVEKPAYMREVVRNWEGEKEGLKEKIKEKENEEEETSFSYKITWVYYGITRDENGKEILRECAQMPEGVEMDFESEESFGEEKEEDLKEDSDVVQGEEEEEEQIWKIDL
ncbi:hypothetical protein BPOR_0005g00110 [Botrytis porri]|uniref:Uncharacterized protein n=2 Tax=Botrytis porri TaxID=87229 RepID=A0A4Z1L660_9HELO|nr:hypothetical protein BPOR_0005g00110 [Botrytis porri]